MAAVAAAGSVTLNFVKMHPGTKFANKEARYEFKDADDSKYRILISFHPTIPWAFNVEYGKSSGAMPLKLATAFGEKFVARMQKRGFSGWSKGDSIVLKTSNPFFALNNATGRTGVEAFKAEKEKKASLPAPMTQEELAKELGIDLTGITLTASGPQENERSHFTVRQGTNRKIRTVTLYHPGFPHKNREKRQSGKHKYDTSKWRIEYNDGKLKKGWDPRIEKFFIDDFATHPNYISPTDKLANWIDLFPEDAPGISGTELFHSYKTQEAANEGKKWNPATRRAS